VESTAIRVEKRCTGDLSPSLRRLILIIAAFERYAGATGERVALAERSASANISSRHASRICHST
jgi:hypothetical protein